MPSNTTSSMNEPFRLRVDQREVGLFKTGSSEVRGRALPTLSDFPSDLCEGLVLFIIQSPPLQTQVAKIYPGPLQVYIREKLLLASSLFRVTS